MISVVIFMIFALLQNDCNEPQRRPRSFRSAPRIVTSANFCMTGPDFPSSRRVSFSLLSQSDLSDLTESESRTSCVGPAKRSGFLVLTKRRVVSRDENVPVKSGVSS